MGLFPWGGGVAFSKLRAESQNCGQVTCSSSHNDSNRSLLHSEAVNIFSVLFASTFVYKTVSSTDNKRQQQNDLNDKTFTFIQFVSSRSTGSAKNWFVGAGWTANPWHTSDRKQTSCMKMKKEKTKNFPRDAESSFTI